jgi:hypothetical protein
MRFNSILPLWRKYRTLPRGRAQILWEAAWWLAIARLAILLLPFPRIAHYLGKLKSPMKENCPVQPGEEKAREVGWAIDRATRIFPFRLACYPRALAGWQMLHRRQIAGHLHFGASPSKADSGALPHAWLDACGVEVTGYPEAYDCVEIGYFAR